MTRCLLWLGILLATTQIAVAQTELTLLGTGTGPSASVTLTVNGSALTTGNTVDVNQAALATGNAIKVNGS